MLDWLDDIAARDGTRPAAVLAAPALRTALASSGSAPDRLKRWKEALRRLRYPAARRARAGDSRRRCGRSTSVAASRSRRRPALEGGTITITIRAGSPTELDASLDRLDAARRAGALARLFALLD